MIGLAKVAFNFCIDCSTLLRAGLLLVSAVVTAMMFKEWSSVYAFVGILVFATARRP